MDQEFKMIKEQIESVAERLQHTVLEVNVEERERLRDDIADKFAEGKKHWLWEHMSDEISVRHPNAWRWIGNFLGDSLVILFFNEGNEKAMYRLNGLDLVPILAECSAFEFYITNSDYEYLIGFNHHDHLVASGTAKNWLETYHRNQSP